MGNLKVAIDGPAGAGKSSISKKIAEKTGFLYIDTGAMYRCVGLYAINQKIDVKNNKKDLIFCLKYIKIRLVHTEHGQRVLLNGEDVTERIRKEDVSMAASAVAVIPEVRLMLVDLQREIAADENVIMDGRDIGTYVLPDAQLKIYLTASSEQRALRRWKEIQEKGMDADLEQIRIDIEKRDKNDMEREFAPLRKADDAVEIDTSRLSFEESEAVIYELVQRAAEQCRA